MNLTFPSLTRNRFGSALTRGLLLFFLCLLTATFSSVAQTANERLLADQYFNNGEFEKAIELYQKLDDRDPFGVYPNELKCLVVLKRYDDAEKLARKNAKRMPDNFSYQADICYIMTLRGEKEKAEQHFQKTLKELKSDQGQILIFANAFVMRQDWDHALQVYEAGKRLMKFQYGFHFEEAEAYYQKGDMAKMVDEYLSTIDENPGNLQTVQNILQARIGYDPESGRAEILRTALLRRIQKDPSQTVYSEFLIWLFIQQKDFDSALVQAKALDKRLKEDGSRVLSLADMASDNRQYDVSLSAYQYVIEKGPDQPNYIQARMERMAVYNKKIVSGNVYTVMDLRLLEKDYLIALEELGRSARTVPLLRGMAHLRAFYLDEPDTAIADLDEALALPGVSRQTAAECKLELGDILLLTGNVWDSDLLYAQVDKDFRNDPLGQEAKYRSARLDYFRGDFLWAQAQLDVLKSATSQLIANDALYLSLLISDNIGLDSTTDALMLYARADLLDYRNKYSEALDVLDSLLIQFPDHSLVDEAYFRMAEIKEKQRDWGAADSLYAKVEIMGEESVLADDALFRRGVLAEEKIKDREKAMEYYQAVLTRFPGSLFSVEARKRFRALRGDM